MPGPRFVELIRVSGGAQEARDTPADQRAALDRLRVSHPGILVERIDYGAVSGAADERRDIKRVLELCAARAFDQLRVRMVDRITRHEDPRERFAIFGALLDAGAVFMEASGKIIDPKTEIGELDWTLSTFMAAKERRTILERTLAARKRLAAEGKIQGRPPWGRTWNKRTGEWGEDRGTMEVYRRIFRDVLAGRSLALVADRLNSEGVPTPRGRSWTPAHVLRLVRHPSAAGKIEGWGRVFRCPPVVTEAEQQRALEVLRQHRHERSGPPGHHPALLRRVLRCSCGAPMWVQRGGRKGEIRSYYVCSTYREATDPECRRWHAVEAVDAAARELILTQARRPALLRSAAQRQEKAVDPIAEAKEAAERTERELKRIDREEERIARLMRRELLSEKVAAGQLREVARNRRAAEVEHRAATARVQALERATREAHDLASDMATLARRLEVAGFAEWSRLTRRLAFRLDQDGRLLLTVPLVPVRLRAVR